MKNYWTSKKPINGLRHFVLLNKTTGKDQNTLLMVSALDSEISINISQSELMNKENWEEGWLDLPKEKSISEDYFKFKLINKNKLQRKQIFISENSVFNIS